MKKTVDKMSGDQRFDWMEYPDPRPVEWPARLRRPPTLQEQIKEMVRGELSRQAAVAGMESFEESDDFDVEEDDGLPYSPHELTMAQEERFADASDLEKVEKPQKMPPEAAPSPEGDAKPPEGTPPQAPAK